MTAYIHHLAQVNEIQPVIVQKHIKNLDDKILVQPGTQLSTDVVARLETETLKQFESKIELESEFTAELVLELFQQFISEDPSLREAAEKIDFGRALTQCVAALDETPEILRRLNVLAIQLPDVFDQCLFCSFFITLYLINQKAPKQQITQGFIAALTHDFGLLDIEPDILFQKGIISGDDWSTMQEHPRLSAEFLHRQAGIQVETIRAVLEHHELNNGTGYPAGKFKNQLGDIGRVLHILDCANAIFRKHFRHRKRSLHDMVPILQVNTLARTDVYTDEVIKLFYLCEPTTHCTLTEELIAEATATLTTNAHEIASFISLTSKFQKKVGIQHRDIKLLAIQDIAKQVKTAMNSCGIINEAYIRWVEQVRDEKLDFAYRELEEVLLMSNEIKFHMRRFDRELELYIEKASNDTLIEEASELARQIKEITKGMASEKIIEFLEGQTDPS